MADVAVADQAHEPPSAHEPRWFEQPPRWLFHALLVVPTLALLVSASVPGMLFFLGILAFWGLALGVLVWLTRVALSLRARRRGRARGSAIWWLVAPGAGCVVALLLVADAPLRVRWMVSRDAFDSAVAGAPPPTARGDWVPYSVGHRLGSFDVSAAYRVGDGVIFYEASGGFLDDAGFAYLPSGPDPALENSGFESPEFLSLGGGWYSWTASW